eukprot:133028_1
MCGPFSTTADYTIAWSIFGAGGIVLDIMNDESGATFMNANYWTCFGNENERLFIGGLRFLTFSTIRNIPNKQNFKPLIKVINILDFMVDGYPLQDIKPTSSDVTKLNKLIDGEIRGVYLQKPYTHDTP